jgi:hypothetical protein
MPYSPGSLVRAGLVVCLSLVAVSPAAAQQPEPTPPKTPQFMARYDFHLAAMGLVQKSPHYTWDTHFGGDVDILDYVVGRAKVLVDYEALLGSEYRAFDPNQGNYTLEASGSARIKGTEIAGVFHHVSRHLSDRPKRFAIAWNVAGVRVLRRFTIGRSQLDLRAEGGKVVQHAFVDYSYTGNANVRLDRSFNSHVGIYGRVFGEAIGVKPNPDSNPRGTQTGGVVEAGIRLGGPGGALELYGGFEKRIDADQIDRVPVRWAFAGFRLVNR